MIATVVDIQKMRREKKTTHNGIISLLHKPPVCSWKILGIDIPPSYTGHPWCITKLTHWPVLELPLLDTFAWFYKPRTQYHKGSRPRFRVYFRNQKNPPTTCPFSSDPLAQIKVSPEVAWGCDGAKFLQWEGNYDVDITLVGLIWSNIITIVLSMLN